MSMNQFVEDVAVFFRDPAHKSLVKYVRDKKNRPRGAVTAVKNDDTIFIGWSLYNKNKERKPFSKEMALAHALRHSVELNNLKYDIWMEAVPHSMRSAVREMMERAERYFLKPPPAEPENKQKREAQEGKEFLAPLSPESRSLFDALFAHLPSVPNPYGEARGQLPNVPEEDMDSVKKKASELAKDVGKYYPGKDVVVDIRVFDKN